MDERSRNWRVFLCGPIFHEYAAGISSFCAFFILLIHFCEVMGCVGVVEQGVLRRSPTCAENHSSLSLLPLLLLAGT